MPVEVGDHLSAHAQGIHLVLGQVVSQPRHGGVHLAAAKGLVVGVLAGGHLHQGRSGQEHLGLLLDEDVVVGHSRLVGAAGRGRAEDHADGGDAQLGELDHLVEEAAGFGEVIGSRLAPGSLAVPGLHPEVGACRLHEAHVGHPVVAGDLDGPHPFLGHVGGHGAAQHGGVVADDDTLHAGDHADADHEATANCVRGVVSGQGADFQERAVGIQHVADAFPDRHLVAGAHAVHGLGAAAGLCLVQQFADDLQVLEHVGPVPGECLGAGVELRRQGRGEELLEHGPTLEE